jgi:hypothetical protein
MRIRALLTLVALAAVGLPLSGGAPPACAAEARHAALVISTGHDVLRLCVALDAPAVSGLRLIELAHDQQGLSYRSDGAAMCMLAGTGTMGGDCFGDYPNFWGYWRGDGSGGWSWSKSGAAATTVHPGDIEGWSWGSGDDGATHPRPPSTTLTAVCVPQKPAATPAPSPSGSARPQHAPSPTTPASAPSSTPPASPAPRTPGRHLERKKNSNKKRSAKPGKTEARPEGSPSGSSPSPSALGADPAGLGGSAGGGFPVSGLGALVVAGGLLSGGWLLLRRRNLNA